MFWLLSYARDKEKGYVYCVVGVECLGKQRKMSVVCMSSTRAKLVWCQEAQKKEKKICIPATGLVQNSVQKKIK